MHPSAVWDMGAPGLAPMYISIGAFRAIFWQPYLLFCLSDLDILHIIGKILKHRISWSIHPNDQRLRKGRDIWINDFRLLIHANRIILIRQTKCFLCWDQLKCVLNGPEKVWIVSWSASCVSSGLDLRSRRYLDFLSQISKNLRTKSKTFNKNLHRH